MEIVGKHVDVKMQAFLSIQMFQLIAFTSKSQTKIWDFIIFLRQPSHKSLRDLGH